MKRSLNFVLALLVIAALALGMFAVAEAPAEPEAIEGIEMDDTDIEVGEDDETGVDDMGLALGELVSEDPEAPATVVYRFIVGDAEYQVQQVREGEAVLRPEDPAAPEGMIFAAWVLEDGAPLFADADGDGETDPVIAHVDAQGEVKVWASFAQSEEAPVEEQPAEEQPIQEPSPLGEGGAAAPEEVVPQAEPTTADEEEGETTSSDSPDGEPASPEGEALSAPEEVPAEEQPAEEATTDGAPVANALTYTGEAQPLVTAGEGWLFSMDGEAFTADIPTAVDAGDYTLFFKAAEDAEPQALTVTVAKADVVLIPPEAMTGEA